MFIDDNFYQILKMKLYGIFIEVNQEVGEIIVVEVNYLCIVELLMFDWVVLWKLIMKEVQLVLLIVLGVNWVCVEVVYIVKCEGCCQMVFVVVC